MPVVRWRLESPQRIQQLFALLDWTAIAGRDGQHGRPGRSPCERHGCGQLIRSRLDELVIEAKHARRHAQRVRQSAGQYQVDRMKLIFKGGGDAEVAATTSDAPEQVLVLLRTSPQQLSVGGHYVDGYQVVAGESIAAVEPAQPAAEREPCDPCDRHDAERRCQPERLRGAVELAQCEPGLGTSRPCLWIYPDAFHPRQVKHDCAVTHRVPRDAVTAPTYRDGEVVSTCELDAAHHVGRIHRLEDGQRASINHAVEHCACRVVASVVGPDHLTPQTRPELATNRCARDHANQSGDLAP